MNRRSFFAMLPFAAAAPVVAKTVTKSVAPPQHDVGTWWADYGHHVTLLDIAHSAAMRAGMICPGMALTQGESEYIVSRLKLMLGKSSIVEQGDYARYVPVPGRQIWALEDRLAMRIMKTHGLTQ